MRYIFYIMFVLHLSAAPAAMADDGKIWSVADQKFITEKKLLRNLVQAKNILLGIRTDNPNHHRHAAHIIGGLAKMGLQPSVLLSYVERDKQNAFAIFTQRHKGSNQNYDATGLDMLLNWSGSGQSDWAVTRPAFDIAMLKKLPLKAVNFSRYEIGEMHQNGLGGLPADVRSELLPLLKIKTQVKKELRKAHCDMLPPEVLEKFTMIRRARNGLFALAIADVTDKTAILIAPQEHVNKDNGVPRYLDKPEGPDKNVSLLFIETGNEKGQKIHDDQVDYIWYTEKIPRPRPCQHHLTN